MSDFIPCHAHGMAALPSLDWSVAADLSLTALFWLSLAIAAGAIVCALFLARREAQMLKNDRQREAIRNAVRSQLAPSYPPDVWHG